MKRYIKDGKIKIYNKRYNKLKTKYYGFNKKNDFRIQCGGGTAAGSTFKILNKLDGQLIGGPTYAGE